MTNLSNITFADIYKYSKYKSSTLTKLGVSASLDFVNGIEIINKQHVRFSEMESYHDLFTLIITNSLPFRIWHSMCIDFPNMMYSLAMVSFHKSIDPTTFDKWQFLFFQTWYQNFIKIAEEQNKKNGDEQQNSMVGQNDAVKSSMRSMKSSMKVPKIK